MKPYAIFVQVQTGLEDIAEKELLALGIKNFIKHKGGFELQGHWNTIFTLNLKSLVITRVLIREKTFKAFTFYDFEKQINDIDLSKYLSKSDVISVRVKSIKSKLFHEKALEERFHKFLCKKYKKDFILDNNISGDSQLFLISSLHDEFTLSVDSSGQHLHKRGYLNLRAKAPLRETIATALLLKLRHYNFDLIFDPFCGGGTIPIEALRLFSQKSSDNFRSFSFEKWENLDLAYYKRFKDKMIQESVSFPKIIGSDIDSGNIEIAKDNLKFSCLDQGGICDFNVKDFFSYPDDVFKEYKNVLMISNPPWGKRLDNYSIESLYKKLSSFKHIKTKVIIIPDSYLAIFKKFEVLLKLKAGDIGLSAIRIDN